MSKVAVLLAEGFEESETLTIVDILRRAHIECHMISTAGEMVRGSHDIVVKADALISEDVKTYDMIVLPGGMPGAANLRDDDRVIQLIQEMNQSGKYVSDHVCGTSCTRQSRCVGEQKFYRLCRL